MKNAASSRREFIVDAGKIAIAAAVVGPMIVTQAAASSGTVPVLIEPFSIKLTDPGNVELTKAGGVKKIPNPVDPNRPIIVMRISERACTAFSSRCSHLGCEVGLPQNNVITCPCHKSTYDMNGTVTRGPAQKNLKAYSTKLEGGILTISEPAA